MNRPPPSGNGRARRLGLPDPGDGVGLRDEHFAHLMRTPPAQWGVGWFEIISENFLDNHGYARAVLDHVLAHRPVVIHGVSMSLGSSDPLDFSYLRKLKELAAEVRPLWISDHVCWTGIAGLNTHDLLPMPLTEESLRHTADRARAVQDFLGRPIVLENPSTYLEFAVNEMPEWEFLSRLTELSGCGLLLDLNNIHVSGTNHGFDPVHYVDAVPAESVVQFHLAGPSEHGELLIDTHDHPVPEAVWPLYARAWRRCGPVPGLVEWDASVPPYETLLAELATAKRVREAVADA